MNFIIYFDWKALILAQLRKMRGKSMELTLGGKRKERESFVPFFSQPRKPNNENSVVSEARHKNWNVDCGWKREGRKFNVERTWVASEGVESNQIEEARGDDASTMPYLNFLPLCCCCCVYVWMQTEYAFRFCHYFDYARSLFHQIALLPVHMLA